jgi:hypothetical protein
MKKRKKGEIFNHLYENKLPRPKGTRKFIRFLTIIGQQNLLLGFKKRCFHQIFEGII